MTKEKRVTKDENGREGIEISAPLSHSPENSGSEPPLESLVDEDLAALIASSEALEKRRAACDALLERYYEPFDLRIRAVLASRNLDYSPTSEYYNTVFFAVFQRTFTVEALTKKLLSFRPEKGRFQNWFLGAVVVNEVKDWLKKKSGRADLAMADLLAEEDRSRSDQGEEVVERLPAPSSQAPEAAEESLSRLSPELRETAELLFLAYEMPSKETVRKISDRRNEPEAAVRQRLRKSRDRLRESDRFREAALIDLRLAIEQERVRYFESLANRTESRLLDLGIDRTRIESLAARPERPWKEIREERKAAREALRDGEIDREDYDFRTFRLQLETCLKRLREHSSKLERLRETISSGKGLVRTPNREIADLLNLPEGTVASRLNALKRRILAAPEKTDPGC